MNSELGNKGYETKRLIYKNDSKYKYTRHFAENINDWNDA